MATNKYFQNFTHAGEQGLVEDLIIEAIQMYGIDIYYLPRTTENINDVFRDSPLQSFNSNYEIEVYIRDVNGFSGDGKFLSKFGLEIRDEMTFSMAIKRFRDDITPTLHSSRPREGDVIYLPMTGKAFQIKFVDNEAIFYQMGSLQIWDIVCEVFEYSNEVFNTGVAEIDDKFNAYNWSAESYELLAENGDILTTEYGQPLTMEWELDDVIDNAQNDVFQSEADKIIDWTEVDVFSEGRKY